jgi:hypothetical protein
MMLAGRGPQGERGASGPRGAMGDKGDTVRPYSWQIDRERFSVSLLLEDGTVAPALELRPLFEDFYRQVTEGA